MRIRIHQYEKTALLKELIDEFIPPGQYTLLEDEDGPDAGEAEDADRTGADADAGTAAEAETDRVGEIRADTDEDVLEINRAGSGDRDTIKREIFREMAARTGKRPDWGILTGVRPVKLAGELLSEHQSDDAVRRILKNDFYLSDEKADLIIDMYHHQIDAIGEAAPGSAGIYVGIPFCPTRCLYCSFASNQVPDTEIEAYLPALHYEIEYCGRKLRENDTMIESFYIGGGTPTTLTAKQMDELLDTIRKHFDLEHVREFTVEAGRPDTITPEKLRVLKENGVDRISINPQSMKQKTLDIIGRSHTPEDIIRAFETAKAESFDVINADLIAGLPEETPDDFKDTLEKILELGAGNVTIHTLAVKRASRLIGIDSEYHYKAAGRVGEMLKWSRERLDQAGLLPYYLYRQKHMAGYFENTGYAVRGAEGIYNIRIMDEHQSILALGAGGISKRYFPELNRLVRVPNVTNYTEYIKRIEEMCMRKENKFFN